MPRHWLLFGEALESRSAIEAIDGCLLLRRTIRAIPIGAHVHDHHVVRKILRYTMRKMVHHLLEHIKHPDGPFTWKCSATDTPALMNQRPLRKFRESLRCKSRICHLLWTRRTN